MQWRVTLKLGDLERIQKPYASRGENRETIDRLKAEFAQPGVFDPKLTTFYAMATGGFRETGIYTCIYNLAAFRFND